MLLKKCYLKKCYLKKCYLKNKTWKKKQMIITFVKKNKKRETKKNNVLKNANHPYFLPPQKKNQSL